MSSSKWYRAGKAKLQGDKLIGAATYWKTAAMPPMSGDMLILNDKIYEVLSVDSDEQITVTPTYTGAAMALSEYAIMRSASATTNTRLAAQVSDVLDTLGNRLTVSTTAPSAGQGRNGDVWIVAQDAGV